MIGVNDQSVAEPSNLQYFPRLDYSGKNAIAHTAVAIGAARDFDMGYAQLSDNTVPNPGSGGVDGNLTFYQIDSNPLIARISRTRSESYTND